MGVDIIFVTVAATVATAGTFIVTGAMTTNTDASLTARWAVALWGFTAAGALWYWAGVLAARIS